MNEKRYMSVVRHEAKVAETVSQSEMQPQNIPNSCLCCVHCMLDTKEIRYHCDREKKDLSYFDWGCKHWEGPKGKRP